MAKPTQIVEVGPTDGLDKPALVAALQKFLEEYPLFRRLDLALKAPAPRLHAPHSITLRCNSAACKVVPVTTWLFEGSEDFGSPGHFWSYRCARCQLMDQRYWVEYQITGAAKLNASDEPISTSFTIWKIGQRPAYSIELNRAVAAALSGHSSELYKRGLICISQSYGLGAVAYFRRVVEEVVDQLMNLIEEGARGESDQVALDALARARASTVAEEKLRLIVDVLPVSLRPGGLNPIKRIFDDYSRALHRAPDTVCLDVAIDLQRSLEFVFVNIADHLRQAREFRAQVEGRAGDSASN